MHLIRCDITAPSQKPTRISDVSVSPDDGYNVLDEFRSLDESNSFHTSHNRRILID